MAKHVFHRARRGASGVGPVWAGYLIAAGRFDLAFLAAGVIGLGAPLIVAGWRSDSAALAVLSMAGATHLWPLVAAVVTYAAGVATTTAATSAFITDVTRRARYGAAHGVFDTIYDVGDALGPIAAGLLVATVGYARMFQVMALWR